MLDLGANAAPKHPAIYIRWSTDEQGHGTTLEVQREACEYYCRSQGWTFRPDLVFIDEGCSGAGMDRPALNRLRAAVQNSEVDCVIVYKLDRLSRNLLDCVTLVRREWSGRCALYSTKENFDTRSPVGQMVFNILVSFAEFERNVIRDRTLSGKKKRAEQGRNAGQRYPYGYKKGSDGEWVLDGWDEERRCFTGRAAIVRQIFAQYLSGTSARAIADWLREAGVPSATGGAWRYNSVSALLANPAYAGRYAYGRRRGGRRAPEPLTLVAGAIPAIVSEQEWEHVQRLRARRAAQSPRSLASSYLLSGLLRCAKCGGTMAGAGKARPGRYRYYVCTNRVFLKSCDCAYINADDLEGVVLREVQSVVPADEVRRQSSPMEEHLQGQREQWAHAAAEAQETVAATERKRKRLEHEFYAGGLDGREYTRLSAGLDAEAREAGARLARAREELSRARGAPKEARRLAALARRVDPWQELTQDEVKQALRELISSMVVYQQKAPARSRSGNPNLVDVVWRPFLVPISRNSTLSAEVGLIQKI